MKHQPIIHPVRCACDRCAPRPVINLRPIAIAAAIAVPLWGVLIWAALTITPS